MPVDPWQNPKVVELLSRLHQVQPSGSGRKALCPAHADMNPSMQIDVDQEDGRILIHCHAGCDAAAILRALGYVTEDNEPNWSALFLYEMIDGKRCVAKYNYVDEHGTLIYQKLRFEPKTFQFRKPTQQGGWIPTIGPNTRRVVYHLDEIQQQSIVYIPEGEKDVDNLRALGLVATCNDSGASRNAHEPKWKADHSNQLQAAGVQMAIVLADNDEAGSAHALAVAQSLGMVGIQAKVLHLPGLPEHGDVTDWIEAGATVEDLQEAAEEAPIVEVMPPSTLPPPQLPPAGNEDAPIAETHLIPIEELLLELTDVNDPWVFLTRVKNEIVAGDGGNSTNSVGDRLRFIDMFYAKAAVRSEEEREALIQQAKPIFNQPVELLRRKIKALAESGAEMSKIALTVRDPAFLCEAVLDLNADGKPRDPFHPVKYIKWTFASADEMGDAYLGDHLEGLGPDDEPKTLDNVTSGGVLYAPFSTPSIEDRNILLPTGVEEYGTEEELFNEVLTYVKSIYYVPEGADELALRVMTGYVMMTWVFDKLDVVGYFRLIGKYNSGKTHLINTLAHVCYRPLISLGTMSAAVMFRVLEKFRGTLAVDEADFREDDDEIFRILNGGYQKGSRVPRCVGDNHEPEWFNVFGPKLLAGRIKFPDEALDSRCFPYETRRITQLPIDPVTGRRTHPDAYTERQKARAASLHNKLLLWRFRRWRDAVYDEYAPVEGSENLRGGQIIKSILAACSSDAIRAELQNKLVSVVNADEARRKTEWLGSRAGRIASAFLTIINASGTRPPDYSKWVTVDEIASKINAGKTNPQDQLKNTEIGNVLSGRVRDGFGLEAKRSRDGVSYAGGAKFEEIVRENKLLAVVKRPLV